MRFSFLARRLITLAGVAFLPVAANSAVKDPQVTVDMKNLQQPEYAPLPAYPKEALRHSWGGLAIYEIHSKFTGEVAYVFVRLSTGHPVLDEAGKNALAKWRWHGGRYRLLAVPMTFNPGKPPSGPSPARGRDEPKEFAAAKDKGLIYAPRPPYPLEARRKQWSGKGVFELRFNSDGTVSSVVVLQSTGHDLLDENCKTTFAKWRSRPGLYTKLRFPIYFSVDGAKQ